MIAAINIKSKDYVRLYEQAERRVNCLVMGLSLAEADALPDDEYGMLIKVWNSVHNIASSPMMPTVTIE